MRGLSFHVKLFENKTNNGPHTMEVGLEIDDAITMLNHITHKIYY